METFLLDIKNVKYRPSIISCACAYIVMKFFKVKNYHESYNPKFYIVNYEQNKNIRSKIINNYNHSVYISEQEVKDCAKDICLFIDDLPKTKFKSCQNKYSRAEQEKVAIIIMNR